jgi:hypothetical protein
MDRNDYTSASYEHPHVPPATPPVIDRNASAEDAATLANDNGDSDDPGSKPAHFNHGRPGGDQIEPGRQPDEIVPGEGDTDQPGRTPDEVSPDQGDFDNPDSAPAEVPAQPDTGPIETPPPD